MNCLGLVPVTPATAVASEPLIDALFDVGLFDGRFDFEGKTHFSLGDRFFSLVSFLGCMPYLVLDPEEGMLKGVTGFCHAEIIGPLDLPSAFATQQTRRLKCSGCGAFIDLELAEWKDSGIGCANCDEIKPWGRVRLGDTGAFARSALLIHGVHRAEAVPGQELMETLKKISGGVSWRHFYLD